MGQTPEVSPVTHALRLPRRQRPWLLPLCLGLVVILVFLDWMTPAGIVVGILVGLPIIMMALGDDVRATWIVGAVAVVGFLVAAMFGRGPIVPAVVWAPNRVLAFLTLPASLAISLLIQRARLQAASGQEEAARASDLNRLLLSLLAHDMRSPLSMAVQAMEYVRSTGGSKTASDDTLLADVEQRLRRGLSAIDRTLALAPRESSDSPGSSLQVVGGPEILTDLEAEARSFEAEAAARGKRLAVTFGSDAAGPFRIDPLLARQALAILVDNAVRYAVPGSVRVTGRLTSHELRVTVADDGPGDPVRSGVGTGSGVGLALCRALVSRAGGEIEARGTSSGTNVDLRLPLEPVPRTKS